MIDMKIIWKNSANSWGAVSKALHWLTALTIVGLFALGFWMTGLTYYSDWYKTAPYIHKSIGVILFVFVAARIVWRVSEKIPDPLPSHKKWEQILAHLMHIVLYVLIFSIAISGYLISTADGRAVSVFGWFEVPATITQIARQEDIAGFVHEWLAYIIIFMAAMHALAAIKHHFIDKDNTLKRML